MTVGVRAATAWTWCRLHASAPARLHPGPHQIRSTASGDLPTDQDILDIINGTLANVFVPHVLGVLVDQDITIRNSDGLLHNINASPTEQRGFNTSQPTNMESTRSFGTLEVMVPLRCDVHGWMNAYIGVLEHPFHSVSNSSRRRTLPRSPETRFPRLW